MAEHSDRHDAHQIGHAPPGVGKYIAVFVALCILTLISFVIGNIHWSSPAVGRMGMLAVSCCKALLVVLFFMHLKWEANWKYVLTVPAIMLSIFLLLMLVPDIGHRTRHYNEARWSHASPPAGVPLVEDAEAGQGSAAETTGHDQH